MPLQYQFAARTIVEEGRTTQEAIDEIKNWVSETSLPELPEELIVLFLLSCRNEIPATQYTIKAYFRIKSEAPEMFNGRDVDAEDLKKAARVASCVSLPVRMDNNTVIHFFKLNDTNYQNFDWVVSMKLAYMLLDVSQRSNPPNELVVLFDMKGVNFMHLTKFRIGVAKKFLEFLQEAMPLRIQKIHVLNTNYIFDKLLALAKVFIKSELMSNVVTHSPGADMNKFHEECVPAACLPKEYGGELPSVEEMNEKSIEMFRDLKGFFEAEEKLVGCYKS